MRYNNSKQKKRSGGFSLVEVIFAASIFALVALSVYQGLVSVTLLVSASRDKIAATDLINSEFELVRNLSFADVGLVEGIPLGVLATTSTVLVDGREFEINRFVRNIDDDFDGTIDGDPNDLSPADYKMVQVEVICNNCKNPINFRAFSNIAPKNLEAASTNGSLFIRVFDANGDPVPQANVNVVNPSVSVNISEVTNNDGLLQIVDAPPADTSYEITVTKNNFTTDQTHVSSVENPNPVKPSATVLLQQLTQISFIIDKVSDVNVRTKTNTCSAVSSVPVSMNGTKLIGTSPDVLKWGGDFTTDASGFHNIPDLEWDVFNPSISGGFYLGGTNPISPISILPDSDQNIDLVIAQGLPSFLLVSVKDSVTGLPISGANVTLSRGAWSEMLETDQGYLRQTDWSGGSGQLNMGDPTRYHSSDGNIEVNSPDGEIKLLESLGNFVPSGDLTSSVFDTGAAANWSRVDIFPTDQPVETGPDSVKFQIATSNCQNGENDPPLCESGTWSYLGPDGTPGTFYTIADNNINPLHDGDRYVRYKIFLSTADSGFTPNVSDFIISFASECIPPGQVLFDNLSEINYDLEVSAVGYTTQNLIDVSTSANWQKLDILMSP